MPIEKLLIHWGHLLAKLLAIRSIGGPNASITPPIHIWKPEWGHYHGQPAHFETSPAFNDPTSIGVMYYRTSG